MRNEKASNEDDDNELVIFSQRETETNYPSIYSHLIGNLVYKEKENTRLDLFRPSGLLTVLRSRILE